MILNNQNTILINVTWKRYNKLTKKWEPVRFIKKADNSTIKALSSLLAKKGLRISNANENIICRNQYIQIGKYKYQLKNVAMPSGLLNKELLQSKGQLYEYYSPDATWSFRSIKAAADYIEKYMDKKGAVPNVEKGKEYWTDSKGKQHRRFYTMTANGKYIETVRKVRYTDQNGQEAVREVTDKKFVPRSDNGWDNGPTFVSEWKITGKQFIIIRFEQIKEVERQRRDYHDPLPDPWTHQGTRTGVIPGTSYYEDRMQGKVRIIDTTHKTIIPARATSHSVRTYRDEDTPDTTLQRQLARKSTRRSIEREHDDQLMHQLGYTPEEYREYKRDLHELSDSEWTEKYGRRVDTEVDYI